MHFLVIQKRTKFVKEIQDEPNVIKEQDKKYFGKDFLTYLLESVSPTFE